jgi:hypothetical protein
MNDIETIAEQLVTFEAEEFDHITEMCIEIFRVAHAQELEDFNNAPR